MMQHRQVEVAAQHTLSILRWRFSKQPLDKIELLEAFNAIYRDTDAGNQLPSASRNYRDWKAITFDGVALAYNQFFSKNPDLREIKTFLNDAGDNTDWSTVKVECNDIVVVT